MADNFSKIDENFNIGYTAGVRAAAAWVGQFSENPGTAKILENFGITVPVETPVDGHVVGELTDDNATRISSKPLKSKPAKKAPEKVTPKKKRK